MLSAFLFSDHLLHFFDFSIILAPPDQSKPSHVMSNPSNPSNPNAIMATLSRAMASMQAGNLLEAEFLFKQVLLNDEKQFEAIHFLGVLNAQRGNYEEAERLINNSLQINTAVPEAFANHARVLNMLKRYDEAIAACNNALALRFDFTDALSHRSTALRGLRRLEEALADYNLMLRLRPNDVMALNNRGNVLHQLKRHGEALADYDKALAIAPNYAEALNNRGVALAELKRLEEALASYEQALAIQPNYAEALNNRGNALDALGRFAEALTSYEQALAIQPNYDEALYNRGSVLQKLKRFEESLASIEQALILRPGHAETLNNRGVTLHELKRYADALASYEQALALQPNHVEALNNRGSTLRKLRRFEESLASIEQALILRPDHAETLNNRGATLHELRRFTDALASYERALAMQPNYAEALNNRGHTLQELKRFEEALASFEQALALRPDYAYAHWNESLLRLLTGDFSRGWAKYEWRWKSEDRNTKHNFSQPLWLGAEAIDGKTILLHSEQGFGDTIQFCRYVPLVAARGARVILEVEKPLRELMAGLAGVSQVVSKGEPLPDFTVHCPLASLPLAFATQLESIPADMPYLSVPKAYAEKWKQRLPKSVSARIGICWAGNPNFEGDLSRSIGLRPLLPLLTGRDAQFFSIQKDLRAEDSEILQNNPQITHLGKEIETFGDTAAIISMMDMVISSDTSVVHLAGALGKPVWILLQFVPDWRWLLDRDDCPWYPSARLFRQDGTRGWDGVIRRVQDALRDFVENHTESR